MEKIWKCIVIDDELHAVELLEDYIDSMPSMEVFKSYTNPLAALAEITEDDSIDFIFLDIDMPKITGLELAAALRSKTDYLIFTTAHSKFAIDAFEVNADQFLLKPIAMSKFALTINQLLKRRPTPQDVVPIGESKSAEFFIKTDQKNKLIRINPSEIIAIEGMDNYVKIHTVAGPIVAYFTLKELEEKLNGDAAFFRVQKSFIVARYYITHIEGHMIHCLNGLVIPLGLVYKSAFIQYLAENTFQSTRKTGR